MYGAADAEANDRHDANVLFHLIAAMLAEIAALDAMAVHRISERLHDVRAQVDADTHRSHIDGALAVLARLSPSKH